MDTELPSPVAGSNYHTALLGQSTDDKGFTLVARVVALFDRGIKRIKIDVQNFYSDDNA